MRRTRRLAVAALGLVAALGTTAASASPGPSPIRQVSHGDPAASCTAGAESGTLYPSAEDEPYVAVNPWNPRQSIGVFQQDRWSNGGAKAGGEVWTRDGVHYSEQMLPFGVCAGAGATNYERVSDLWISWGPDGAAYASGLEFNSADGNFDNGVGGATSFDGGATWKYAQPVTVDNDPAIGDDKNSVTADPLRPGTAYQVWDRLDQPFDANGNALSFDGPALISITHDHGKTWSKPSVMVDSAAVPFSQTIGNVIVPDARTGALYDFFDFITFNDAATDNLVDVHYGYVKSTNGGTTWSAPQKIAADTSVLDADPNNPDKVLRSGSGLPSPAIDPVTGELYMAYEGSDFTGGAYDQIQLTHSTDGGATWSAPTRINQDPNTPAYTPSIAVDLTGTVHISYYDVRDLPAADTTNLPTSTWLLAFPRGQEQKATEKRIAPDFDWLQAPNAGGYFLGDYEGLAAAGVFGVQPIFVTTANAPADPTDVYTGTFHGPFSAPVATPFRMPISVKAAVTHAAGRTRR
jgi:hypothetical protein